MKKKKAAGAWTYDHRVGVSVTLIVYLVLAISLVGSKIVIRSRVPNNMFLVDLQSIEELQKEQQRLEQEVKMRQMMSSQYEQVLNRVSNENARQAEQEPQTLRGEVAEQVAAANKAIEDRMRANMSLYEQGEQEIADMWASKNKDKTQSKNTDSKVSGMVTVEYSLTNPLRHSVYLEVPAYRCERGGVVKVDIVVNRNGDVVSASVNKAASDSDNCMQETAVSAARRSRFDINTAAPERHFGTITYRFVPQ